MTEAEAIRLCQEGSPDAFRHLVEQHKNTLFGTAVLMTGNRAAAEEHVQEAFLSAWRGISGFRRGRPFKPWVVRILVNRIVSSRRTNRVQTAPIEDAERVTGPADVLESAMSSERRDEVEAALSRLNPRHHQVVVLRYFAELTLSEISGAIGVREGTVKSRLSRALSRLRKELMQTCDREARR